MKPGANPDTGNLVLMTDNGAVIWTLTRSEEDTLHEVMLKRRLEREPAGPPDEPMLLTGDAD